MSERYSSESVRSHQRVLEKIDEKQDTCNLDNFDQAEKEVFGEKSFPGPVILIYEDGSSKISPRATSVNSQNSDEDNDSVISVILNVP